MDTLNTLRSFSGQKLTNYPHINLTNIFKRILNNFHFEMYVKGEKFLYSPLYVLMRGLPNKELEDFISQNEEFLDSLKEFIVHSLFVYSSVIEENSYYLSSENDILIGRLLFKDHCRFEVKFYSHYQDELLSSYEDKIYLGRDFINLNHFERECFGLKDYFHSIHDQNNKIQERARHKLRYYEEYKKQYLDEIQYMAKEVSTEALERLRLFPKCAVKQIPTIGWVEMLDHLLYIQNLMIELRDFTSEFENILRQREEQGFVKYLFKFSKDLINDIKYLTKLSSLISLKVAKYSVL